MDSPISLLERLVVAVEKSGTDLAPSYQEYMPLAFAVANSCGEPGRDLFHRLCRLSAKYRQEEADKLYDHALRTGKGGNSLGTVFHLAERAGVRLEKRLADLHLQSMPPPAHTRTHTCVSETEEPDRDVPPAFADYRWPAFLQQVVECGESKPQRDILLLGAVTVIGATLNRLVNIIYGRKCKHPCLQTFVIAPPASGKGVLTWVRRLAEPAHDALMEVYREKMKVYRQEKTRWDTLGKQRATVEEPEQPRLKMFLIAGDNSGTGILENLIDADGAGLICETEADTVSSAIGTDYGHWSDTLRKSFDHERLAYNRRTNHEYRECRESCLSVLLSGTPAQVRPLIPSAENGLFSRQLFYCMPAIDEWTDQFDSETDYDSRFTRWGGEWKRLLDRITAAVSGIHLKLSPEQKEEFNRHLASVFGRAGTVHGGPMKSTVARIAVNVCRILSVVSLLRSLDGLLGEGRPADDTGDIVRLLSACPGLSPSPRTPQENLTDGVVSQFDLTVCDADFQAVLSLVEPLYLHAGRVLALLPAPETPSPQSGSPVSLFDRLPLRFTRQQALHEARRCGMPESTLDSHLRRLTAKGRLSRNEQGEYEFTPVIRSGKRTAASGR